MAKKNKALASEQDTDQLQITHAVIVDEQCTYSYSVQLENGDTDIITNACGRQYHFDLKKAFRNFDAHLAVITEQVDAEDVTDIDESKGINDKVTANLVRHQVTEVKLFGKLENGSIQLSGIKILSSNEEIKLKTPKFSFGNDYDFINELVSATQNLVYELTEYHNGKSRPELQAELFNNVEITMTSATSEN